MKANRLAIGLWTGAWVASATGAQQPLPADLAPALPDSIGYAAPPDSSAPAAQPPVYLGSARNGDPTHAGSRRDRAPASIQTRAALDVAPNGELWGRGTGYWAQFEPQALRFYPAVGTDAGDVPSWRFELETVGRRGTRGDTWTPAGAAELSHSGRVVRYTRPGVVETYDVRAEGVEQSFWFSVLPPGDGDLVVRGRLTTTLASQGGGLASALSFGPAGRGVHVGAVTGIDARGVKCAGWMQLRDGALELGLPAAFVAQAALPLVLDPLIGASGTVASPLMEDPDVAYDATTDSWLVVFKDAPFGPGHWHISAQRLDAAGALVGGQISIAFTGTGAADHPRVANVNQRDHFVVVWEDSGDIYARAVNAATGATSSTLTVASGADNQITPDVGGEATTSDDDVVVVWENQTDDTIEACQVQVSAAIALSAFGTVTIASGFNERAPAIAQSGGASGQYLIVWERAFPTSPAFESEIYGEVRTRNLTQLAAAFPIAGGANDEDDPAVDGNGTSWVVAYETEGVGGSGDNSIACRGVTYTSTTGAYLSSSEVIVEGDAADDEIDASVSWNGGSCLIGYADETTAPDYDPYVKSVDPFSCLDCEGEDSLALGESATPAVMMASQLSGDPTTGNEVMIVWESPSVATIEAQRYRGDDGTVFQLASACGNGGSILASCARAGNPAFALRLQHAAPGVPAFLVLATARANAVCGACTLIPDPFTGFVFSAGNTDARGNAALTLPIPAGLPAVIFFAQWATVGAAPACAALGVDLSNATSVVTQ